MGKIILLDIDGTITDYENNIPNSAITAIRSARKNGHNIRFRTSSRLERYTRVVG